MEASPEQTHPTVNWSQVALPDSESKANFTIPSENWEQLVSRLPLTWNCWHMHLLHLPGLMLSWLHIAVQTTLQQKQTVCTSL